MWVLETSSGKIGADIFYLAVFADQVRATGGNQITVKDAAGAGNMHFVQLTFQGSFKVIFTYHAAEAVMLDGKPNCYT